MGFLFRMVSTAAKHQQQQLAAQNANAARQQPTYEQALVSPYHTQCCTHCSCSSRYGLDGPSVSRRECKQDRQAPKHGPKTNRHSMMSHPAALGQTRRYDQHQASRASATPREPACGAACQPTVSRRPCSEPSWAFRSASLVDEFDPPPRYERVQRTEMAPRK